MRPSILLVGSLLFVSLFAIAPLAADAGLPVIGSASASCVVVDPDGGCLPWPCPPAFQKYGFYCPE